MNELTDGQLLQAFHARGDEVAFAEVLRRHGGAVQMAARAVVGEASLADDIAQATFLSLARKGATLEQNVSVGAWLYHVTICLARNARRDERRRAAREKEAVMAAAQTASTPALPEAARAALHEELGNLAERYRAPLVLHHLEGRSYAEAAAALGCNPNAFGVRLNRAREKLRQRLVARGVTLGADGVAGVLGEGATSAVLPAAFVAATCQAASLIAAGKTLSGTGLVSAKVAYLTKSALKTLFWAKVKTAAAAVVLTAGVAVGGGLVAHQVLAHRVVTAPAPAPAPGGQVWAWGDNQFGQLGDGTTNNSPAPVPVPGLDGVMAVAAGAGHTVALRRDRTVWTWGHNKFGQLGDGTTTQRLAPGPVKLPDGTPLGNIAAVAAGSTHSVALTSDGHLWAWGDNEFGQLGDGTTERRANPAPVPGVADVLAIAAGGFHTVIVRRDRTVWTWGQNSSGQVGDGTTTTRPTPVPAKTANGAPLAGVIAIAAGLRHTVAIKDDHTVWTCGYNFHNQLGQRHGTPFGPQPTFESVPAPAAVMAIAAGKYYTLALADGGAVWTWGSYHSGERFSDPAQSVKTAAGSPLDGITAIAAGEYHAVALAADGGIWTWGENSATAIPVHLPAAAAAGIAAIAAGGSHTVILVTKR